jgi:hypothetical protein
VLCRRAKDRWDDARTSRPGASARSTTVDRGGRHVGPPFRPAGRRGSREAIIRRAHGIGRWRRCVTPRQACPRPDGFGRNLRSKTRWFTGFCNSHQVSHFATFFIDARAEISVAESRFGCTNGKGRAALGDRLRSRAASGHAPLSFSVPWRLGRRGLVAGGGLGRALALPRSWGSFQPVRGSLFLRGRDNDPSAGSPTETLLRLLLPLNDKVQWTSRDVAGSEPPTSPRSEHFTGPFNR